MLSPISCKKYQQSVFPAKLRSDLKYMLAVFAHNNLRSNIDTRLFIFSDPHDYSWLGTVPANVSGIDFQKLVNVDNCK